MADVAALTADHARLGSEATETHATAEAEGVGHGAECGAFRATGQALRSFFHDGNLRVAHLIADFDKCPQKVT